MEKKLVYHDSYLFHNTSTLPGTLLKEGKMAGFRDSQTASYYLGVNMEPIINQGFWDTLENFTYRRLRL